MQVVLVALLRLGKTVGLAAVLLILVEAVVIGKHAVGYWHLLTRGIECRSGSLHTKEAAGTSSISVLFAVAGGLRRRQLVIRTLALADVEPSHVECFWSGS